MRPITVSQLNGYIKRILQSDPILGNISVIGEISNIKYHGTGHVYFSMKDENSKINCFLPSNEAVKLRYELADGMEITASGYMYVYEKGGTYSLNIREIEVSGQGDLSIAFEKLKEKLRGEGLFDAKYKKPLSEFPKQIALVTSGTGAALEDMLKIIKGRNNYVDILIFPVLVQGAGAGADIANAIAQINKEFPEIDAIITGRGGGSMEELWAFNEEIVARSIFASKIPVISAVGHETDVTIADFVADVRAETPTAAAILAVPDTYELKRYIDSLKTNLHDLMDKYFVNKTRLLDVYNIELFVNNFTNKIELHQATVNSFKIKLDSLNPKNIMSLGYGAILDEKGALVGTATAFKPDDFLKVVLADGSVDCNVVNVVKDKHDSK